MHQSQELLEATERHPLILILDDEAMVTTTVATMLALEGDYEVKAFNEPELLIAAITQQGLQPEVVISDYLMPNLNGLDVFKQIRPLLPNSAFILLTGYADKENAIAAINDVGIYRYIEKPWDNTNLKMTVDSGVERARLLQNLKYRIQQLEVAQLALAKANLELEERVSDRTRALKTTLDSLNTIFDNTADGIVTLDNEGRIQRLSPKCLEWLGLLSPQTEMLASYLGQSIYNYLQFDKPVDEALVMGKGGNALFEARFGQTLVECHSAALTEGDGGVVLVLRDIQQRRELERLRDDFVATLTHDMRTPLLASIQTIKLFKEGAIDPVSPKQTEILGLLLENQEDLIQLVNTLLEIYRYEAGQQKLVHSPFDITQLSTEVTKTLASLAEERKQNITLNATQAVNTVMADKFAIKRVLTNLIGNAIRYTQIGGQIEIGIKYLDGQLLWQVQDNGRGIPISDQPHLFERFVQGTSKHRNTGSGLGLYLSRMIIEAHQGQIGVNSVEGQGSVFYFTLPNNH